MNKQKLLEQQQQQQQQETVQAKDNYLVYSVGWLVGWLIYLFIYSCIVSVAIIKSDICLIGILKLINSSSDAKQCKTELWVLTINIK